MKWKVIPVAVAFLIASAVGVHAVTSQPGATANNPAATSTVDTYASYEPNW